MKVPSLHVQPSISDVVRDLKAGKVKSESVWVEFGQQYVNFDLKPDLAPLTLDQKLLIVPHNNEKYRIRLSDSQSEIYRGKVTCGDANSAGHVLVGSSSGELGIFTNEGEKLHDLGGHLLDTTVARFFPSEKVAISSGLDYSIKIWDLELDDPQTPVESMQYQRGAVESIALIDRGRNFLSACPNDNERSVCLWETSQNRVVRQFVLSGANSVAIWDEGPAAIGPERLDEYNVSGKAALVASDTGLQVIDLRSEIQFTLSPAKSTSVAVSDNLVFFNTLDNAQVWDIRARRQLETIEHKCSAIAIRNQKIAFSEQGSLYTYDLSSKELEVLPTGSKVTGLTFRAKDIWSFGDYVSSFSTL